MAVEMQTSFIAAHDRFSKLTHWCKLQGNGTRYGTAAPPAGVEFH
jgi:hypothetical protein